MTRATHAEWVTDSSQFQNTPAHCAFSDIFAVLGQLPDSFEDTWVEAVLKDREAVRYFPQRVDLISPPMVKRYWNDVADVHREGAVVPRYRIAHASRVAMRGMVLASAASKGPGRIPLFHHLLIGERKQRQHLIVGNGNVCSKISYRFASARSNHASAPIFPGCTCSCLDPNKTSKA